MAQLVGSLDDVERVAQQADLRLSGPWELGELLHQEPLHREAALGLLGGQHRRGRTRPAERFTQPCLVARVVLVDRPGTAVQPEPEQPVVAFEVTRGLRVALA